MIKNITKISFASYGTIAKDLFDNIHIKDIDTQSTNLITTFNLNSFFVDETNHTIIDIEEGTALLYVYTSGTESNTFFLDKCVILHPDVFYKIIPLYNECVIKVKFNTETTILQMNNLSLDFSPDIKGLLKIDKIYTLFYQEFDEYFAFKGEKHDFWEITYVDQGELLTRIADKEFILTQGNFIFYAPNQYHTQKNNAKEPISFLTISFEMDFEQEDLFINKIFHCSHTLKTILEKILSEKDYNGLYSPDLIICYLKEFIIELLREFSNQNNLKKLHTSMQINTNNIYVNSALDYIYQNFNKKITINEIAHKISISPSYLSRIFKYVVGVTIIEYINNYRLEKSKEYIKSTELSLTQIAEILGFNSIHYFSKQFKKKYEISPIIYSKSLKNN
ncbi:hypothetical protein SH1V18_39890 [Vallitalea longa]|uniref:HTH araC/xylS-type domain-containing protein n=1 Tax=Vallitalea longa TaxID=2936439 RepID=A0A9W5YGI3_9FIRM|nr:helix-turn-helix domain-containing protein [Vallitalea longa]GKX31509.1 hypothetical protein SH1V18_39890 [Vallitalea longa]